MIIRVWRGKVKPGMHEKFERFVKEQAIPLVSKQPGLLAQYVGGPIGGNSDEFVYMTFWENLTTLKGFAGEKWEEAVVLGDYELFFSKTFVHHYEAFHSTTSKGNKTPLFFFMLIAIETIELSIGSSVSQASFTGVR